MNHSFSKFFLVIALAGGTCTLFSCKKEASESPQRFEPGINGIAVAPLPPIDEAMAKISLDDLDAVPSHRSTSLADDSFAPAAGSRDEFADDEADDTMSDTEDETSDDFSFDSDDANSF